MASPTSKTPTMSSVCPTRGSATGCVCLSSQEARGQGSVSACGPLARSTRSQRTVWVRRGPGRGAQDMRSDLSRHVCVQIQEEPRVRPRQPGWSRCVTRAPVAPVGIHVAPWGRRRSSPHPRPRVPFHRRRGWGGCVGGGVLSRGFLTAAPPAHPGGLPQCSEEELGSRYGKTDCPSLATQAGLGVDRSCTERGQQCRSPLVTGGLRGLSENLRLFLIPPGGLRPSQEVRLAGRGTLQESHPRSSSRFASPTLWERGGARRAHQCALPPSPILAGRRSPPGEALWIPRILALNGASEATWDKEPPT